MITENFELRIDACTKEDIHSHLSECDHRFRPPLTGRVDIGEYSRKLRTGAVTFEAWSDRSLAGLVAAYVDAREGSCFISNTSVLGEFSRRGVATRLLMACLEYARAANVKTVTLEVSKESHAAIGLYRKLGFEIVDDRGALLRMRRVP